jgi:hypothetical protein
VRRPGWLSHPNAVTGIAGVTIMVEATEPLRAAYDRLFGAGVNTTDDVLTVHVGQHRMVFATPDDVSALYPQAEIDLDRQLPAMVVLSLRSSDLGRTADHLTQWQVEHEELAGGTILVPPKEANGAALIFARA